MRQGMNGHCSRSCEFYNDNLTLEQNKKYFKTTHKGKLNDDVKLSGGAKPSGDDASGRATGKKNGESRTPSDQALRPLKAKRNLSRRE